MNKKMWTSCVALGLLLATACDDEPETDEPRFRSISGDTVFNVLDEDTLVGDCVTDDTVFINNVINDAELVGGSVFFPEPGGGCYLISGTLSVDAKVHLWGRTRPEIRMTANDAPALSIKSNDVSVTGLAFVHPTPSDSVIGDSYGIVVPWDETPTRRNNIEIRDVYVEGFHHTGIRIEHADDVAVTDSEAYDISYSGIMLLDVSDAIVEGNRVDDLFNNTTGGTGPDRVYGVFSTRVRESGTVDEVSKDVVVSHNRVRNADLWHCYDSHGGKRNSFVGNLCLGSSRGVAIGGADNATGTPEWPADTIAVANVLSADLTDGTALAAVDLSAPENGTLAPGLLAGANVARGYGQVDLVDQKLNAAMQVRTADGALFHGNNLVEPFGKGTAARWGNTDVAFVANMVTGLYGTWGRPVAYSANQDNPFSGIDSNSGLISGNRAGDMDSDDHVVTLERYGNEFTLGLNSSNPVDDPLLIIVEGGTTGSAGHQADDVVLGQGVADPQLRFFPVDSGSESAVIRLCDGTSGANGHLCLNPGAGDALQVWEGGAWVGK